MGQILLNVACGVDKGFAIGIMLLDTGGNGENVGIENYIFGREAILDKKSLGTLCNLNLTLVSVGLATLVEEHYHHCSSIATYLASTLQEELFALFER